jgi:hypothetical protein
MDVAIILLSLLTNTPLSPEDPPEQTLHALAAYVRTVSMKKGLRARRVARALGIKPCLTDWPLHKELSDAYQRWDRQRLGKRLDRPRRRGLMATRAASFMVARGRAKP